MSATLTLTVFLLARIAEDEAVARAVPEVEPKSSHSIFTSLHEPTGTVEISPARVLAECEAKRRIVEDTLDFQRQARATRLPFRFASNVVGPIARLASAYADHPDYGKWRD